MPRMTSDTKPDKPALLATQADLDTALARLCARDPRLAAMFAQSGNPALRRREAGFAGLAAIIVAQQLSTASAAAIWGRLQAAYNPFAPERLARAQAARLARLGLSAPKIRTLKAVGQHLAKGHLDLAALRTMDADDAHAALTRMHGVGPWTADIYLLFCLGHADAWPAGDLALQEALRIGLALPERPAPCDMAALAEPWRPLRGAVAHLLWAYYKVAKSPGFAP